MATTFREAVDIVNATLRNLGYDYFIDTTSEETMTSGLEGVGAFPPSQYNNIMEQMNLIIQQRNYGVMFDSSKNKFRRFLIDMTTEGFGIEDVFHEIIEGIEPLWDKRDNAQAIMDDLVSYDDNKIHKFFHTASISRSFKTTIDERNYDKVFTKYGITRYIDTKLANLSWSAEYWLMNKAIDILKSMISDGKIVIDGNHSVNDKSGIDNTVEAIKATMAGFKTVNNLYNYGVYDTSINNYRKVLNATFDDDDIFLAITPEFLARLKVYGYSNAFNLSQYELEGRILYLPSGTELGTVNGQKVLAIAFDRRAIILGIKRWKGTSFFIPNVDRVNHWLNVEGMSGYNTVFNAVAFTGDAIDTYEDNQSDTSSITMILSSPNGYDNFAVYADDELVNFASIPGGDTYVNANRIKRGSKITITTTGELASGLNIQVDGCNITPTIQFYEGTVEVYPNNNIRITSN